MADPIIFDSALEVSRIALDGLSSRRNAIAQNIANTDTPGYKAIEVDFETALKSVVDSQGRLAMSQTNTNHQEGGGGSEKLAITKLKPGGTLRADGNNVDIDMELTDMLATNTRYQTISQSVSKKLSLLKTLVASR